jgi:hypothetical protein
MYPAPDLQRQNTPLSGYPVDQPLSGAP